MSKNLSTFAIAKMLHVDPGSVANWIDQGLLKAYRTPGGHRRVSADNLLEFLRAHSMPIPNELQTKKLCILVVDDQPEITQMIARAIKEFYDNIEISEAHDGFRAGTFLATSKPDLVILDLEMPGMDSFAVCKLIKSQESTRHTQIIGVTAVDSPENEARLLQCGAKMCLKKPLNLSELMKHIQECV